MDVGERQAGADGRRFVIIGMDAFKAISQVGHSGFCVLAALNSYADQHGRCWPSLERLAALTCLKKRAVQNALGKLRKAGLVSWKPHYTGNLTQTSNHYLIAVNALPLVGRTKMRGEGAPECAGRAHQNAPELDQGELDQGELEVIDHVNVFVSCEDWQAKFNEFVSMLPRRAAPEDRAFVGQLAWLLKSGANIWPKIRDAFAGVKACRPRHPVAYLRTILNGTVGEETLKAMLRRAPSYDESRRQLKGAVA